MQSMRESTSDFDHIGRPYLERQCQHCGDWTRLDMLKVRNIPIGNRTQSVDSREWSERPTLSRTDARTATPGTTRSRLGTADQREITIPNGRTVRLDVCELCAMAATIGPEAVNARLVAGAEKLRAQAV
jgi:hypothetical protein